MKLDSLKLKLCGLYIVGTICCFKEYQCWGWRDDGSAVLNHQNTEVHNPRPMWRGSQLYVIPTLGNFSCSLGLHGCLLIQSLIFIQNTLKNKYQLEKRPYLLWSYAKISTTYSVSYVSVHCVLRWVVFLFYIGKLANKYFWTIFVFT